MIIASRKNHEVNKYRDFSPIVFNQSILFMIFKNVRAIIPKIVILTLLLIIE